MKNPLVIVGLLVLLAVLYLLYKKYVYFPHAQVISVTPGGLVWTNGDNIISDTIRPDCAGSTTGYYANRYEYQVQCLANKQFRFIVHKKGNPNDRVVDNIYSFTSPPLYLTK